MCNKKNLLLSWIVGLLSFMFILNSSAFAASSYLEPVDIPAYNASNSTHVLITPTNGKWASGTLNNSSYKHFYVKPGDYTSKGIVSLTVSGTKSNRRTISLYNGNDTHPAALSDNKVANVQWRMNGGSYWTIDRMADLDHNHAYSEEMKNGASHNIYNRFHLRNYKGGVYIYTGCHFNTVQKSYINEMTYDNGWNDFVGLAMYFNVGGVIEGTKFLDNDVKNANDGIMTTYHAAGNSKGSVLDGNRIWITDALYSNGDWATNGNNPNGKYDIAENAFDLKAGSLDENKPMRVINNIMWGYRQMDLSTNAYTYPTPGVALELSYKTKNTIIDRNIVFDSQVGIHAANLYGNASKVTNNIIYDIGGVERSPDRTPWQLSTTVASAGTGNINWDNNTLIDMDPYNSGHTMYIGDGSVGQTVDNNVFINTQRLYGYGNEDALASNDNSWFYNHTGTTLNGTKEHSYETAADANMADYTFEYERYTASPKTKTLPKIISTKDSPHYGKAGSSITQDTQPEETEGHWMIVPDTKKLIKVQN